MGAKWVGVSRLKVGISRAEEKRKRCGADAEEGSWRGKENRRHLERKKWGFLRNLGEDSAGKETESVGEESRGL